MLSLPKILILKSIAQKNIEKRNQTIDQQSSRQVNTYRSVQTSLANQKQEQSQNLIKLKQQEQDLNHKLKSHLKYFKSIVNRVKQTSNDEELTTKLNDNGLIHNEKEVTPLKIRQQQHNCKNDNWKPETRESTAICTLNKTIYMYGGQGIKAYSDLYFFENALKSWIPLPQMDNNNLQGRHGHSMIGHKDKLFVFGGRIHRQFGQLTNEMSVFSLSSRKWETSVTPKEELIPRFNSASCQIGRFFLIHGGQDSKRHPINDLWAFDMGNLLFIKIKFGSITSVYDIERKMDNFINDRRLENIYSQIKKEGIYFFQKQLKILNLASHDPKLEKVITEGQAPRPRSYHTATFNTKNNFYVICGGKNKETVFNDVIVLNLTNLTWIQVDGYGDYMQPRCGHNSVYNNSEIYIFGGYNFDGYINFDAFIIQQGFLCQNRYQK